MHKVDETALAAAAIRRIIDQQHSGIETPEDHVQYLHEKLERITAYLDALPGPVYDAAKGCGLPCGFDCNGACFIEPEAALSVPAVGQVPVAWTNAHQFDAMKRGVNGTMWSKSSPGDGALDAVDVPLYALAPSPQPATARKLHELSVSPRPLSQSKPTGGA